MAGRYVIEDDDSQPAAKPAASSRYTIEEPLPAPKSSIVPRAIPGAEDVNRPGIQRAQDISQAPRIERPLQTYQQPDALQALQYRRPDIQRQQPQQETGDLLATAAPLPRPDSPQVGALSRARARMETRGFGSDPSAPAARRQLEPIANILEHPVGASISGAMGVAKGATLGLMSDQVDRATAAMPSLGLTPSKLAEGAGEFAGVVAPWEGIASVVGNTFGLVNAGRVGRIATQAATGGIVGGEMAQNEGKDIVGDQPWDSPVVVGAAGAGLLSGALEIPAAVRSSEWWRMLTNKERGLVVQSLDDVRAGLKGQGWDDGRVEAKIARLDPETFQAALKKRIQVEGYEPPAQEVKPKPVMSSRRKMAQEVDNEGANRQGTGGQVSDSVQEDMAKRGTDEDVSGGTPAPASEVQAPESDPFTERAAKINERRTASRWLIEDEPAAEATPEPVAQEQKVDKKQRTRAKKAPAAEPVEQPPVDAEPGLDEVPAVSLKPAIRSGQDTVVGEAGSTHPEVLAANEDLPADAERGFVAGDGEFMTRAEAKDWMEQNQPSLYDAWVEENGDGAGGELHSQDLNAAQAKAEETSPVDQPSPEAVPAPADSPSGQQGAFSAAEQPAKAKGRPTGLVGDGPPAEQPVVVQEAKNEGAKAIPADPRSAKDPNTLQGKQQEVKRKAANEKIADAARKMDAEPEPADNYDAPTAQLAAEIEDDIRALETELNTLRAKREKDRRGAMVPRRELDRQMKVIEKKADELGKKQEVLEAEREREDAFSVGMQEAIDKGLEKAENPSAPPVTIPSIPSDLANRAFNGTSHSPERRGQSFREGFRQELTDIWQQFEKRYNEADEDRQAAFIDTFNTMAAKYGDMSRAYLSSHGNVMSAMIVGPARFPTDRNRKKMDAADNKMTEALEYIRKMPGRLNKVLTGPKDNSVNSALDDLRNRLAKREKEQEQYKAINAALRKKDPDAALRELGVSEKTIEELKKPDFGGRTGIPSYRLANNNAEIRRLKDRVAEMEKRAEQATPTEDEDTEVAQGLRVVKNAEAGRLQLFFDEKPSADVREQLKAHGFKWAPSQSAWQRQLTANADAATKQVVEFYKGTLPEEAPVEAVEPTTEAARSAYESAAMPEKTRTAFESAWEGKDIAKMQEYLHPDNKNLRAEFESRSGEKLPRTVKGTDATVEEYFTRVEVADEVSETPADKIQGEIADTEAEIAEAKRRLAAPRATIQPDPQQVKYLARMEKKLAALTAASEAEALKGVETGFGKGNGDGLPTREEITAALGEQPVEPDELKLDTSEPKNYTAAVTRPSVDPKSLKTPADVLQAFRDGKLDYATGTSRIVYDEAKHESGLAKGLKDLDMSSAKVGKEFVEVLAADTQKSDGTKVKGKVVATFAFPDQEHLAREAGADLLSWGKKSGGSVEAGRPMLKRLAAEDKEFRKDPTFTVKEKSGMLTLEFRVGKRVYNVHPEVLNIDRASGELPASGNPIKEGDTIHLSPGYLEGKQERVYLIPYGSEGTTFYDITSVVPLALKDLAKLAKSGREAMPHLEAIGRAAYEEGARKWQDFARAMREKLGDLWQKFKGMVEATFERVKRIVGNEVGAVGRDIKKAMRERYLDALDKADKAVEARDLSAADEWIARADEIEQQFMKMSAPSAQPEPAAVEPEPVAGELQEEDQRTTSTKNAVTEEERAERGLDPVEQHMKYTDPVAYAEGMKLVNDPGYDPREQAKALAEKPRPISAAEQVALLHDRVKIRNDSNSVMESLIEAQESGDSDRALKLRQRLAALEDNFNDNDVAARRVGTEWSASGRARQLLMAEDYSYIRTANRVRAAIGKREIPEEIRARIESLTKQLEEALAQSKAHEERIAELEAQRRVRQMRNEEDAAPPEVKRRRAAKKADRSSMDVEFHSLADKFRTLAGRVAMNIDPEMAVVLAEMARNRVIAGITDAKEIIADIYEDLKDIPDLEPRDIRDAISGYGESFKMSQDEINVNLREARRQMRLISALEDAEDGVIPAHSGLQRDAVSEKVRELQKEIKEAMRESGIDSTSTRSPEQQWKTALDAAKTRLKNQIHDITEELKTGKKAGKKVIGLKYDEEANTLKAVRDRLKKSLDEIEGKKGMSDEQRVRAAESAVQKSISDYERRIAQYDLKPRPKGAPAVETPALKMLRARRDALAEQFKQMQKDARPTKDPMEAALKAYKTRTMKRAADLQEMLTTGNFEKRARRVLQMDPESERLKERVAKLKEQVDAEVYRLERQNRGKLEKYLEFQKKAQRGAIFSTLGVIWKISASAAVWRPGFATAGNAMASAIRLLPPLRKIYEGAPRHGSGLNVKAEAAGYVQLFRSEMYRNFWDRLKQGKDGIQIKYAKHKKGGIELASWGVTPLDHAEYVLDFPGRAHSALKSIAYIQEFYKSLQYRTEWAIRNDWNMNDEIVRHLIFTAAEADANEAQFMADNVVNNIWRSGIGQLKKHGLGGMLSASLIEAQEPVMKVPLNVVGEIFSYIPPVGTVKALTQLAAAAMRAGKTAKAKEIFGRTIGQAYQEAVDEMTEREKENFAKNLNRAGIGVFLLGIGYALYKEFGGFYKRGEKRKVHDLKPGEARIFGVNVPANLLHFPGLSVIQVGSMIHHVEDLNKRREDKREEKAARKGEPYERNDHGFAEGVQDAAMGVAEEVPFVSSPLRLYQAAQSYEGMSYYSRRLLESLILPSSLPQIANKMDKFGGEVTVPRKGGFAQDVPFLRQKLPLDMKKVEKMPLDQLANIMENAPSSVTDQIKPTFRKKFRNSHGLEQEERERYSDILRSE